MRVVFLTREPLVHQFGGSTTAALNLMEVLVAHGCEVDVVVSSASSRSPRLFWRRRVEPPEGVRLSAPGFLRVGNWYLNPFSPRAWGRFLARLSTRAKALGWLRKVVEAVFSDAVAMEAWDLTPPEQREIEAALRFVAKHDPDVVVANYAFWAPIFAADEMLPRRSVVLMHDLLSARVRRFREAGLQLDCAPITLETELGWLNQAEIVLAIQETEAAAIRGLVSAEVLVQPIVLPVREASVGSDRNRCLFVGTRITPNLTGIQWFLDQVWPSVLKGNPKATLVIAGSVCEVLAEGAPRVRMVGVVSSLDVEFQAAGVCVVPLLVGSGLKIKLVEALAYGKACVATPIGVQGLEGESAIAVAGDAEGFAAEVLRLMGDDGLRAGREVGARELVRRRFGVGSEAAKAFSGAVLGR